MVIDLKRGVIACDVSVIFAQKYEKQLTPQSKNKKNKEPQR